MKKTLLTVGILAGFASVAHAQNSVTLYGLIDMSYQYTKNSGESARNGLDSGMASGSRWGLKGSEDLGGGLKANFQLESGFEADTGERGQDGQLFGRAAWAGLSGGFGEVRFGRQDTSTSDIFGSIDPMEVSYGNAEFDYVFLSASPRVDNSIKYISPEFGGFSFGATYSFNINGQESIKTEGVGTTKGTGNRKLMGIAGQYSNGPVLVAASYDRVTFDSGLRGKDDSSSLTFWNVGGVYDFGVATLNLAYGRNGGADAGGIEGTGPNPARNAIGDGYTRNGGLGRIETASTWMVGGTLPLGNGKLMASYYRTSKWDITGMNVAYSYNISKRTNMYTYFSRTKNLVQSGSEANKYNPDGTVATWVRTNTDGASRGKQDVDTNNNQFGVGIRHSF